MKRIILCGESLPIKYRLALGDYADSVLVMPRSQALPGSTGTHPDMLGFAYGDRLLLCADYYHANAAFFDSLGACITVCPEQYGEYPRDVRFNALVLGDTLLARTDMTAAALAALYPHRIHVRQGYTRCSALPLGRDVITADRGIADAARKLGGEALLIAPGHIELEGYGCGFIGGALALPAPGVVMAFGDLYSHPDGHTAASFAAQRGYSLRSFADEPLLDCGGILILEI